MVYIPFHIYVLKIPIPNLIHQNTFIAVTVHNLPESSDFTELLAVIEVRF